jgi:HAD superfamily hydrolase (TIGR01509 family)
MLVAMLVIFDCDGVLVDSEVISNRVLAESLTAEGLPTTLAQSRAAYQGLLLEDIRARAESKLGRALPEGWVESYERDRNLAFERELEPVSGVASTIERLVATDVDICVASQGRLEKTRLTLTLTGLRGLFADDTLFSAYTVPRGKPHPDLFLHAARERGYAPSECVVIEDSPSGVTAAVAAAMRVLGYTADSDEQSLRQAGAETFGAMHEVPALLGLG